MLKYRFKVWLTHPHTNADAFMTVDTNKDSFTIAGLEARRTLARRVDISPDDTWKVVDVKLVRRMADTF